MDLMEWTPLRLSRLVRRLGEMAALRSSTGCVQTQLFSARTMLWSWIPLSWISDCVRIVDCHDRQAETRTVSDRIELIRSALQQALVPSVLEIEDQSHLHAGHAGARDGRGHFHVTVESAAFAGLPLMRRHKLIYAAVGDLMQTDIHALSITATAPES
jgi:BolA protein